MNFHLLKQGIISQYTTPLKKEVSKELSFLKGKLSKEKEVVGIYISGHPLDDYKFEINNFCNAELSTLRNLIPILGKDLSISGVVTNVEHKETKNGTIEADTMR